MEDDYSSTETAYRTFCNKRKNDEVEEYSTQELIHYWSNIVNVQALYGFELIKKSPRTIFVSSKTERKRVYLSYCRYFWHVDFYDDDSFPTSQNPIFHTDMLLNITMIEKIAKFFGLSKSSSTEIEERIELHKENLFMAFDQYRLKIE
uniref:Uncharacterized protein n=1 Tax=viral metagenome TaxID=1070528 RepID=A0A6C0C6G7_9ZZZZ